MGILGYPNMDDNNRDGMFGDYSDVYSNYPEENGSAQAYSAEQTQGFVQPQGNIQYENKERQRNSAPQAAPESGKQGGRLFFYVLVLGLLSASAAGMYLYKNNMLPIASQEQSMGDYFYDQAVNNSNNGQSGVNTTTVDVDLNDATGGAVDSQNSKPADGSAKVPEPAKSVDKEANSKTIAKNKDEAGQLTASEKVELKKQADSLKEKQIGFSSAPVTITVGAGGRKDPFLPANLAKVAVDSSKFELIAPPPVIPAPDPLVDELMQAKISGIMYDSARPSAILNIGGSDHLVHKGDSVNGYRINDITRNTVVVQYKSNIYNATVGQSLDSNININPVSNLSNSFGGVYAEATKNVIQISN